MQPLPRWPRSIDPAFTWGNDQPPRTPWHETVIYELHVRGFTKLHPDVPEAVAGNLLPAWPPIRPLTILSRWASRPWS